MLHTYLVLIRSHTAECAISTLHSRRCLHQTESQRKKDRVWVFPAPSWLRTSFSHEAKLSLIIWSIKLNCSGLSFTSGVEKNEFNNNDLLCHRSRCLMATRWGKLAGKQRILTVTNNDKYLSIKLSTTLLVFSNQTGQLQLPRHEPTAFLDNQAAADVANYRNWLYFIILFYVIFVQTFFSFL